MHQAASCANARPGLACPRRSQSRRGPASAIRGSTNDRARFRLGACPCEGRLRGPRHPKCSPQLPAVQCGTNAARRPANAPALTPAPASPPPIPRCRDGRVCVTHSPRQRTRGRSVRSGEAQRAPRKRMAMFPRPFSVTSCLAFIYIAWYGPLALRNAVASHPADSRPASWLDSEKRTVGPELSGGESPTVDIGSRHWQST